MPVGQGIVIPVVALGLVGGSLAVLLPASAARGGDIASAGYAFSVFSFGGVAGGILHDRRKWNSSLRRQYLLAALALAAGTLLLVPVVITVLAIPAVFLVGLPMTPIFVLAYLIVDERIENTRCTEANSWIGSGYNLGSAAGSAGAGALIAHLAASTVTAVVVAGSLAGALSVLRIPAGVYPSADATSADDVIPSTSRS